jgi:SAM-dependent methyltransferase
MLGQIASLFERPTVARAPLSEKMQGVNLFLVGFLVLFLELACIRWFAFSVVFLQFFTNVVLIACFLGMSCGCLAARSKRDWLRIFPWLALATVMAALAMRTIYHYWSGLAIDVGQQASPQEVFFGTEYRNPDVAQFTVPIEFIVAVFFILIALMFVGLGQVLGRAFDAYPNRVMGYTLNIGGSIAGIVGFSVLSFLRAPPQVWFAIACAGIGYLLYQDRALTWLRTLALIALVTGVTVPSLAGDYLGHETRWSPYYAVVRKDNSITVNTIGHQWMVPFDKAGGTYSLIHLLQRHSGGKPFQDVLIIGAGSGNDLAHALRFEVSRIDAVEIDPVIQDIGIHKNVDQPYQDPRTRRHLDDGRHFLRTTDHKYDLVVYALVDSLILHSSYASIRLESYLFTEEAFADIKRVLKPDGVFVAYNHFRQGWIVERVATMAESVWGCKPIVLSLPYLETLKSSDRAGFTMVIATCNTAIAEAFKQHGTFWLNSVPPKNIGIDGFIVQPDLLPQELGANWLRIAPTALVRDEGTPLAATDDWPFLYLRDRTIPNLTIRSMLMLGTLGVALVYIFLPKGKGRLQIHSRFFFLGAAFMLLETKAVVQLALLFGSTWLVNSLVFFTVLIMILLANLYVLKTKNVHMAWHYAGLFIFLSIGVLTPIDAFLGGGLFWHYVIPCVLALGPMFFSGVIFARSFRDVTDPDMAFGSNIAGSVVGGLAESFSILIGFRYLLLLAILCYMLSIWSPSMIRGRVPSVASA